MTARKRAIVRTVAALALALLLAGSTGAAGAKAPLKPPAKTYPTGSFAVAGTLIAPGEILDARSLPDMQGKPSLMVTITPAAAAAIHAAPGMDLPCTLDGKPLGASPAGALADHVIQISGSFADYDAAAALARRISGRDPLPDSDSDE
jgi:hypothetical protein